MPKVDSRTVAQAVQKSLGKRGKLTETGDRAPDELGTVTGWRAWRVARKPEEDGSVLLRSASYDYVWVPFEKARASCESCRSEDPGSRDCVPGEHCSCGFYTAKTLPHLRSMGYHMYDSEHDGEVTIVGRVANWGKVIPGTQGWRAEYAYPEMLYVPFEVARMLARAVADTYGVPVTLLNLLDPSAKPSKRGRRPEQVIAPRRVEPKFLAEFHKAHRRGDVEMDDTIDDEEIEV
jgi:hypothetical protein